jgi:hypothetical protein
MTGQARLPTVGDRAFWLDAGTIGTLSVAICLASDQLAFMTALVPSVLTLRLLVWSRLPPAERGLTFRAEVVLLLVCTLLGAANDWNSVVRHHVYDYRVPCYFPEVSTIPVWMLLYWGMILRFVTSMALWQRLRPPDTPANDLSLGPVVLRSPWRKVTVELLIVAFTRQAIYRTHEDPLLSWLPFAIGLALFWMLLRAGRHDRTLALIFVIGGPLVEIAYIHLGNLHHYHLGWIAGVPLWIVLWWALAVLIWKDLSARLVLWLAPRRIQSE